VPHLWIRTDDGDWAAFPLEPGTELTLARVPAPHFGALEDAADGGAATIAAVAAGRREESVLFAPGVPRATVNGLPVRAGIRVLAHQDEVRLASGAAFFFSTEQLARIEPLPAFGRRVNCARCQQPIEEASAAVRCPACDRWHHERPDLPCWSHVPKCATCPQATALDAGFRWTPADL